MLKSGYKKAPYSKLGDHFIEGDFVVMTQSKGQSFHYLVIKYKKKIIKARTFSQRDAVNLPGL